MIFPVSNRNIYFKSFSTIIIGIMLFLIFSAGCTTKDDIPVDAVVSNIERGYTSNHKEYSRIYVTYTVDGKEYTSELHGDTSNLNIGDKITIYYNQKHPEQTTRKAENTTILIFVGIAAFFVIDFIITIILRRKGILNPRPYIPKKYRF